MSEVQSFKSRTIDMMTGHASLVVGGLFTALVALRVLAVAGYDTVTAFAVLQNVGVGSVLLAMVIAVMPAVATVIAAVCAASAMFVPVWRRQLLYVAAVLGVFALVAAPVTMVVAMVLTVALFAFREREHSGAPPKAGRLSRPIATVRNVGRPLVGVGFVVMLLMSSQAWLAPEIVSDQEGAVRVGYVLSNGQQPVMLELGSRIVVYLDSPLEHRQVCKPTPSVLGGRNLLSFIDRGRHAYPSCDAPAKPKA
ncbi:hypothetical protein [Aeromicrobium sp. Root472D3]|uniref:hypothetical protein n=1 Tax=Aeromicrobium sp. Root472D3 TaxID=1736540 RepID=UPI0006FAAA00|nr:hypothetical protein [Aeromicrobium sp. Root472D3]KQX74495.1 hypothetical protein ASD10_04465 [Aeromicrobium sp. Root472D3]